jgi:hypothetical protein
MSLCVWFHTSSVSKIIGSMDNNSFLKADRQSPGKILANSQDRILWSLSSVKRITLFLTEF